MEYIFHNRYKNLFNNKFTQLLNKIEKLVKLLQYLYNISLHFSLWDYKLMVLQNATFQYWNRKHKNGNFNLIWIKIYISHFLMNLWKIKEVLQFLLNHFLITPKFVTTNRKKADVSIILNILIYSNFFTH